MCCLKSYLPAAVRGRGAAAALTISMLLAAASAQASILTFEVFDPALDFDPYNTPGVLPYRPGFGYPEAIGIPVDYGTRITTSETTQSDGTVYQYGVDTEGFTPNVTASYGPFSLFTGGPELWREGFGDLNGVLYQGSLEKGVGYNYDVLDIVLTADNGYDVLLYGFDLAAFGFSDLTINSITVYDGVPFPFLTPTNTLVPPSTNVVVSGSTRTSVDLSGSPLQAQTIWLRIDAANLGDGSQNIGIDNIRFGQVENPLSQSALSPEDIERAFLSAEVPEVASAAVWLVGALCVGLSGTRRQRSA